jgi:hypothetical protein
MAGKQKLSMALKALEGALPLFGASSDAGQAILKAMQTLGKIAQPGDVSQAGEMNQLQKMLLQSAQSGQQQKAIQQQGAGAPGGAPGAPMVKAA